MKKELTALDAFQRIKKGCCKGDFEKYCGMVDDALETIKIIKGFHTYSVVRFDGQCYLCIGFKDDSSRIQITEDQADAIERALFKKVYEEVEL